MLNSTKYGCSVAQCGACTAHIDGVATRRRVGPVSNFDINEKIIPVKGLSPNGSHPLQKAWDALDVPQCDYCQSGMLMAASALLKAKSNATEADIDAFMTNICRCGTYNRVRAGIKAVAQGSTKSAALAIVHADGSTT